jgi:hypothetical protein
MTLNIFDLPTEILLEIFQLLGPFALLKFTSLCKEAEVIVKELLPMIYRKQFNQHYKNDYKDMILRSVFRKASELEITWSDNPAYW